MTHRSPSREPSAWPVPEFGRWPSGEHEHHAVVLGAGIGGLSAAATLAARGLKVLVVEAHDRPGGYCSSWLRKVRGRDGAVGRYVFDAGVQDFSGLGPRGPLRRLLDGLGAAPRLDWRRVRHRYVQDGLCLDVPDRPADLVTRLQVLFPHQAPGIAAFFAEMERVYADLYADVDDTGGVPMPPATLEAMQAWTARRPHAWRWMHRPYAEMLDGYVDDPRLKALLTTISEYVTDRPELLSVREMAPLFGYYLEGGWYPAGGSQRLAELLCAVIREKGGAVCLRTRAERVLTEDGRAAGIVTAGGVVHRAPLVLANSDVVGTLTRLVDPALLPRRYAQRVKGLKRGPTAVLVSLAVEGVPDLPARVFVGAGGLHFGIGNPSAIDASLAPEGHAAVTMLCLRPEPEAAEWFAAGTAVNRARKEAFADRLVAAAEGVIPGLRGRILYRQTASPTTFTRYALADNGAIYGAARGQWCPPTKTPLPGLMLVGAGCQSGPGVEAVVISGVCAANLITGIPGVTGIPEAQAEAAE
ncbi:phytoene desaturase family protein [Azospirillum sp.]|uniref:phytoene desaturase family protein n=1 Tax=Azospirillum sp. TaxID=34012 RepID=UPI003D717C05